VRPLAATVDPERLKADLAGGEAVLVCERPALFDGVGDTGGELVFEGFVAAPSGVESVTVEIRDRGSFDAEIGLQRPDARLVLGDLPDARRTGFRLAIDASEWAPGTLDVRIDVRANDGAVTPFVGQPRWFTAREWFVEPVRAGGCSLMWVDPLLGSPLGETVYVGGCAASMHGIERVEVDAPGNGAGLAWLRKLAPAAAHAYGVLPGWATAYGLRLDLTDVAPGRYPISITAFDAAGASARRHGTLIVDPAERYERWRLAHGQVRNGADPLDEGAIVSLDGPRDLERALRDAASGTPTVVADRAVTPLPGAASRLCAALDAGADVAYGDEEIVDADGRLRPRLAPGWSPELLLAHHYTGWVVAVGPKAARHALDSGSPPVDLRDLMLRFVEADVSVARVPSALARRGAEAPAHDSEAEMHALEAVARDRGRAIGRELSGFGAIERIRWPMRDRPRVSIVIPTLGDEAVLGACLTSLAADTAYDPWEVVLVDSGDGRADGVARERLPVGSWRTVRYDRDEFNFSRAVNVGCEHSTGDHVLYLNDDTSFPDRDWLGAMVEYATLSSVGAVGPLLLDPEGTVQAAGVLLTKTGGAGASGPLHAWRALPSDSSGPNGVLAAARDVAVLSGACTLVPRDVVERIGGWDELFRMDFGDIDLCLRIRELGLRVICVPWSRALHLESVTRPSIGDPRDRVAFHSRWGRRYADGDPWHHPAYRHGYEGELRLAGVDA
jgi:GT2 family glycosyltransferase